MPLYKLKTRTGSNSSLYVSDEGMEYSPVKSIGTGDYGQARLFQSKTGKAVVVLNSLKATADIAEAKVKHRFFQTVYSDEKSSLFTFFKDAYRLVVPYIPHVPYERLNVSSHDFHTIIFLSAISALQDCHKKGIIVIDLKSDNVFYDAKTQKSYLIDGGLSAPDNTPIDSSAFQKVNQRSIENHRKDYWHIAPECWSVATIRVLANPAMDIYSIGVLMQETLINPAPYIKSLIDTCLREDPTKRPTLVDLRNALNNIYLTEVPECH